MLLALIIHWIIIIIFRNLTNPWVIFAILSVIIITGVIVIHHYDLSINDVTVYTFYPYKKGFVAYYYFIMKI